jgi:hypothetical protein
MRAHGPAADLNALAAEELREQILDFRSSDPVAIESWVMAKTHLHLALRTGVGAVSLLGARMIAREGVPVAAVAYRVGNERAALLISRTGSVDPIGRHMFTKVGGVSSWSMGGQVYALACSAKNPQVACLLCHANPEQPEMVN